MMFSQSTQRANWLFENESQIVQKRRTTYKSFIKKQGYKLIAESKVDYILYFTEENMLLRHYELHLQQFCQSSNLPMTDLVMCTAAHYFKCFYLLNSVMDYPPMDIMFTCIFLAYKVLDVPMHMEEFLNNIPPNNRESVAAAIRSFEFVVIKVMKFSLIVHLPHRFINSVINRIREDGALADPDSLKQGMLNFLNSAFLTCVPLLVGPVKLALAAAMHSVAQLGEDLEGWVAQYAWDHCSDPENQVEKVLRLLKGTISCVNAYTAPCLERVNTIEWKLKKLTEEYMHN